MSNHVLHYALILIKKSLLNAFHVTFFIKKVKTKQKFSLTKTSHFNRIDTLYLHLNDTTHH